MTGWYTIRKRYCRTDSEGTLQECKIGREGESGQALLAVHWVVDKLFDNAWSAFGTYPSAVMGMGNKTRGVGTIH